jgi:hypothetical protein
MVSNLNFELLEACVFAFGIIASTRYDGAFGVTPLVEGLGTDALCIYRLARNEYLKC